MKMTTEHYKFIKDQLSTLTHDELQGHFKALKQAKKDGSQKIKDIDERFRWDCFHSRRLSSFACSHLYSYLHDDHIDTALKQIAKELNFPTVTI